MRVLLVQDIGPEGKDYLRERGYEVVVAPDYKTETLKQAVVGMDGVMTRNAAVPEEVIAAADRLKVISRYGVGVESIAVEAATARGIQVCNAPLANSNAVAEHAVAMMTALAKRLVDGDRAIRADHYDFRNERLTGDLEGKTVGLLGLGHIGSLVAQKCHFGFGMKILGCDPYAKEWPDYIQKASEEEILEGSDFVSIHVPATPETHHMIDRAEFQKMKSSAIFINVARAAVVSEEALIWALEAGEIACAGVDVFDQEPTPPDHPYFKLSNILLSPHNAALSVQAAINMGVHAAMGIDEVLSGRTPTWPVNRLS